MSRILRVLLSALTLLVGTGTSRADLLNKIVQGVKDEARAEAKDQTNENTWPKNKSKKVEERSFTGCLQVSKDAGLAIFSDDGCDVTIDGVQKWNRKGMGQHLPDRKQSFHVIEFTFKAGKQYEVTVDYSNTIYNIKKDEIDVDGVTLFVFDRNAIASNWEWNHGIPKAGSTKTLKLVEDHNAVSNDKINVNDKKWGYYLQTKDHNSVPGLGIHGTGPNGDLIRWEEAWESWAAKWSVDHPNTPPALSDFQTAYDNFRNDVHTGLTLPANRTWPAGRFKDRFANGCDKVSVGHSKDPIPGNANATNPGPKFWEDLTQPEKLAKVIADCMLTGNCQ